jgi:hypothetical protein
LEESEEVLRALKAKEGVEGLVNSLNIPDRVITNRSEESWQV